MSQSRHTDQCPGCGAWTPAHEQDHPCSICGWEAPAETCDSGRLLGDCELLEEIGRGGMGIVWRGRQRALNREVAVKTLAVGGLDNAESRARFRTEAQATARLRHPNIVPVFDVGESDGTPFLVMELVAGRNLREVIGGNPVPPRLAAEWLQSAAHAVQHAHEQGVFHRDLKPSNLLIETTPNGSTLRVTDFGLAKLADSDPGITRRRDCLRSRPSWPTASPFCASPTSGSCSVPSLISVPSASIHCENPRAYRRIQAHPCASTAPARRASFFTAWTHPCPPRAITPPAQQGWDSLTASGNSPWMAASDVANARIALWRSEPSADAILPRILAVEKGAGSLALSPDASRVAMGFRYDPGLHIINLKDGRIEQKLSMPGSQNLAWSPDGRWLATSGTAHILWDTKTWTSLPLPEMAPCAPPAGGVAFSPTPPGQSTSLLALVNGGTRIVLVEPATQKVIAHLEAPEGRVLYQLAFSPDLQWLAATSAQGEIQLWNLTRLRRLAR